MVIFEEVFWSYQPRQVSDPWQWGLRWSSKLRLHPDAWHCW